MAHASYGMWIALRFLWVHLTSSNPSPLQAISKPAASHRFVSDLDDADDDPGSYFISAVCWKSDNPTMLAANSQGTIKVLVLAPWWYQGCFMRFTVTASLYILPSNCFLGCYIPKVGMEALLVSSLGHKISKIISSLRVSRAQNVHNPISQFLLYRCKKKHTPSITKYLTFDPNFDYSSY
jgi:hypothetical protein